MAVSAQLGQRSLVESIRTYLTPDVISSTSAVIRESESATRLAVAAAVPALLAGLTNLASFSRGAITLASLVRDGAFAPVADNAPVLFAGGTPTTNMMSAGRHLLEKVFDDKTSQVADTLARLSGIHSFSALSLLSVLTPLVLGVIGKQAAIVGLTGPGISKLLLSQKESIFIVVPPEISRVLASTSSRPLVLVSNGARPVAASSESSRAADYDALPSTANLRRWLWIGSIVVAILLLWVFVRSLSSAATIVLPNASTISVPRPSLSYSLVRYLASPSEDVPKTFIFDHLDFESDSTNLTADSVESVRDLIEILKAYPKVHVQLVGHTDNTGEVEANQKLSVDRANAVKAVLVAGGIDPGRIGTTGFGQTRPLVPNDTEDRRAVNRRMELTVLSK